MFTPSRLTLARKRRGLSAAELARSVNISAQSISNYERGRQRPSPENLHIIADALGFPPQFFALPHIDPVMDSQISFRARSKIPAAARESGVSVATFTVLLNSYIEERFQLPPVRVPTLERHRPEEAAEYVRAKWGIDEASPTPNMVHLLEANGVRVFSLALEYSEIDAFSFWSKGTPYVVLNTLKTGERGRFDAAHELGHLVLHGHNGCSAWPRESEQQANAFASAFLMPQLSVRTRVPSNPTTDQVLRSKKYWRVSALALAYRLNDLGMFTEWNYRRCLIELGRLGFRTGEPKGIDRERSQVLEKVFRNLRQQGVTTRDVAKDLGLSVEELRSLTFGIFITALDGGRDRSVVERKLRLVSSRG